MSDWDISGLRVVIVNWNRPVDTIECIQSLLECSVPASQVLVIDNGSIDNSVIQIKNACPGIEIRRLLENKGFAGGYNFGIDTALKSGATKIFVLNNDTILNPDTIYLLLKSSWDVSVPKIYFHESPDVIWAAGARWRRFPPMVIMRGYQKRDSVRYDEAIELEYATACALMIRREVFEDVGFFDQEFENYFEDYDFIYRARKAGFRIGYVPEAKVWHKVSQSLGLASPQRLWYLGRNSVLFYRKGERYTARTLYIYLGWVLMRELLKMNYRDLPNYWRGIQAGREWVNDGTSRM